MGGVTGREARFRAVFEDTRADLSGYVSRRTVDREEAEDVLSETYAVVWRRLDDAPGADGVRPWTFAIARNVLANSSRAHRRRSRLTQRLGALGRPPVSVQPDTSDDRDGITSAFGRLRAGDRDLLTMAGVEGLDAAEMADILGCSTATLHVRLHRARGRFRAELVDSGLAALLPGPGPRSSADQPRPATLTARPEEAR